MTTTTNNFDFTPINNATRNLTPGMKMAVAQGLITSALKKMEEYKDPLAVEALTIGEELKTFRIKYTASRQAAHEQYMKDMEAKKAQA